MHILTFDIEEWFHILDNSSTKTEKQWSNYEYRLEANMNRLFELLQANNQKATFFVLGWVARTFPHIVKQIDDLGYEIATHSDLHQLAYTQSREEFRGDLKASIASIEEVTQKKVRAYRAPGFSLKESNKWVFEELLEQGISIDCSIFPAKRAHGGFPSYGHAEPSVIQVDNELIKEFPINLYGPASIIFSGGGYFRLLPYAVIKHMMKRSDYVMTYFHPRDFDADQPVIKELSAFRRFKSYVGLSSAFDKLQRLIQDYDCIDLNQAIDDIDWAFVKKIKYKDL